MKITLYKLAVLILLLSAGCTSKESAPETADAPATASADSTAAPADQVTLTADEQQLAAVRTGPLTQRVLGAGLKVNGVLDVPPDQLVSISAPLGGIVESTSLLQGTRVRKGQVLATIRNPEFIQLQQSYLETQSQLTFARAELERQRELVREEVAPAKNLQRAQAEYGALQAQAAGQLARLRLAGLPVGRRPFVSTATLRAPKDAFVKTVNVTVGQSVTPTDALFELVDPEHLHVELTVFERDVPLLKQGQRIRFTLPNDSSSERTASVYLISRAVDEQQRTVRVHGHLDRENDPALLPGMFVRAVVETTNRRVAALPDKAVVDYEGKQYVFRQEPGAGGKQVFRMLEVRRGEQADGYSEVFIPGASVADSKAQYVTEGAYSLLSKLKNAGEEE
ncbi:efflux RND transporter periplasmic adaptor subunit [Hymenobacter chitinivorans]|uniref:Cobalt-zinc-cadmium efflux system membrane fusion protein n=1 Tax=Hymenobacter chitinivorans DSM 11115 TaxID=1121954 RepID=A0A2M9BSQ3_9BACT|nr:efflux RND transporter periplasmic adaptor subunit [Hymenobacter chitinivorans]PJJ60963.1 cobalt-zinc-cadmium efflux system membrane fusion protein [Hymenobacter chitinivorans DSM 11115]